MVFVIVMMDSISLPIFQFFQTDLLFTGEISYLSIKINISGGEWITILVISVVVNS